VTGAFSGSARGSQALPKVPTPPSGWPIASASQLVAGRYDVLAQPRNAEKGRDLLAKLAMRPQAG
jgi:hypothetical protein